jgi:hypothetical protein
MSRIAKENEKYIARVKASMDREKNYRIERQKERDATRELWQREKDEARELRKDMHNMDKRQRDERNMKITQSNDSYSDLWIATAGLSVPQVISLTLRGGDAGYLLNKLDLRVYNRSSKNSEEINLINFIKMLHDKMFPNLQVSQRGQVTLDDIVIPAKAYFFIRYHWLLSTGQAQNQYSFQTESVNPSSVPNTTKSED